MRMPSLSSAVRRLLASALVVSVAIAVAGCVDGDGPDDPIRVGWVAAVGPLDPAAVDTPGSFALLSQLHASLLTIEDGEPVLDLAESAEFTADGEYTVVLKSGLRFANGDQLTSSDVVFSIERQRALQNEDGPADQLRNVDDVEAVDDTTIVFHLASPRDAGFPFVLAGPAGLILDEEAFFADEITPDDVVIAAEAFGGPFSLTRSESGDTALVPFADYEGLRPAASTIDLRLGEEPDLAAQLAEGTIDVLTGRLEGATIAGLVEDDSLTRARAASGRVRLLAFDLDHMPFGAKTDDADAAKAAAIRRAIADLIDRDAIVRELGGNLLAPATGYVPDGVTGAVAVAGVSGDGEGGPDGDAAEATLAAAGIDEAVPLTIHVVPAQVGGPVSEEVALLADQLEDGGLFTIEVVEVDSEGLTSARDDGDVEVVFTSLASATLDPQTYLEPFRTDAELAPGYSDADVDALLARQRTEVDPATRLATLDELQRTIAEGLPAIPVTQGVRVVFSRSAVSGIDLIDTVPLDLSALRR
jgi:peptide/nickel transport system substrate-binding protein